MSARAVGSIAAAILALASLAHAAVGAPAQYRFAATWADLPIADIYLTLDDQGDGYRAAIDIRSLGLMKLLSKFGAHGTAEGKFTADGGILPTRYDTDYKLRKKRNHQNLLYVRTGDGTTAERGPADTSSKPPVDPAFRRNVVDPLSALAALRERMRRHALAAGDDFTIPVYDDKRRFDITGRLLGPQELELNGTKVKALRFHLLLTPIAGFRSAAEEGEDIENKPRPVDLYLSDDARLVPLELSLSVFYLPAVTRLVGACSEAAPCTIHPF
ncbi:MAG TPA: DUF3108 domain-containing protein [Candidatus Sulfotelmatobacter sp.]|nr:DUF3108 domain-containing protein [Candidatus Sulfotelmatobacter sp.]